MSHTCFKKYQVLPVTQRMPELYHHKTFKSTHPASQALSSPIAPLCYNYLGLFSTSGTHPSVLSAWGDRSLLLADWTLRWPQPWQVTGWLLPQHILTLLSQKLVEQLDKISKDIENMKNTINCFELQPTTAEYTFFLYAHDVIINLRA